MKVTEDQVMRDLREWAETCESGLPADTCLPNAAGAKLLREAYEAIRITTLHLSDCHKCREAQDARHWTDEQVTALMREREEAIAALRGLVEHLHPGASLAQMRRWDPPIARAAAVLRGDVL